jgi:hypothetical protein
LPIVRQVIVVSPCAYYTTKVGFVRRSKSGWYL